MPDLPKSDGVWRVYRFETAGGKYAEAASNQVGPEQIPVPPGYRFVGSTPMVPAVVTDEMVDAAVRAFNGWPADHPMDLMHRRDERWQSMRRALTAVLFEGSTE